VAQERAADTPAPSAAPVDAPLAGNSLAALRSAAGRGARDAVATVRDALRVDVPVAVLVAVVLLVYAPLIPRNTANPQMLAAHANDEPFLTMALEATLEPPFLNPGAYFDSEGDAWDDVPAHWHDVRYPNIVYYGGAMFEVAAAPYAVLRAVGLPAFPTGPLVLRALTLLAGVLSLVVLYNISKDRGSRLVGLFAGAWLASDPYFIYYATFIHPDTLQLLFGLFAFLFAVAHARRGDPATLVVLGLFAGLVHGAKAGGVWTVPMALVAIWLGGRTEPGARFAAVAKRFGVRTGIFLAAALAAFFVSTPYAFLDGYYLRATRLAYGVVTQNSLGLEQISLATWAEALYDYLGPVAAALVALTALRAAAGILRRRTDAALVLALVLAVSQFLWYGGAGRLWHVPGYLLLSFGLLAVLSFETVFRALRRGVPLVARAARSPAAGRAAWALAVAVVAVTVASDRWYVPASWAVEQHTLSRSTIRAANEWAVEHGVRGDAVIVYDDLAYFDRSRFPRARMNGGVLTWRTADELDPSYIVLSASLYGADWMQNLIRTQRLPRRDPDPFNVSLYQDLLATSTPGPTRAPGVELAAVIRSGGPRLFAAQPSRVEPLADGCERVPVCDLGVVDLGEELGRAADLERRVRALAGPADQPLVGPELRVFRVEAAPAAGGR
jgi:hypothetical protein